MSDPKRVAKAFNATFMNIKKRYIDQSFQGTPNFQKLPSFINKMNGLNKLKISQSQKICYSHSLCCKLDHLVLFHFLQFHCNLSHNLNIFKYSYLFYHSLFVHQPGINHAPRALVTQVNYSVHRLSTFLRIHADPSMQIF